MVKKLKISKGVNLWFLHCENLWKFKNCFVLIKRSLEEVSGDDMYSKNAVPNNKTVDLNKKMLP